MNMAAAFLITLISSVYSDDRNSFQMFSFVIFFVRIKRKLCIKSTLLKRRQLKHVVIMSESKDAHLHFVWLLVYVSYHFANIIKNITSLVFYNSYSCSTSYKFSKIKVSSN